MTWHDICCYTENIIETPGSFASKSLLTSFDYLASWLNVTSIKIREITAKNANLRRYHCIDNDLDSNPGLKDFLCGLSSEPLANSYFQRDSSEVLPWDFYGELSTFFNNFPVLHYCDLRCANAAISRICSFKIQSNKFHRDIFSSNIPIT